MGKLHSRAKRLLARPLPAGERAEGNATLGLIARYAAGDWCDDPMLLHLAKGCASALESSLARSNDRRRRAYYAEAAAILREILAEAPAGEK